MGSSVVLGAIAMLCSGLLLFDASYCLRSGAFQFGCSTDPIFQLARRQDNPLLYWLLMGLYLAIGLAGMGLGVALVLAPA